MKQKIEGGKKEIFINWLIKVLKVDTNKISDGYHTFEQLYDHRIALWIAFCREVDWYVGFTAVWKSKAHSDGSTWDGWFILGMEKEKGKQMTYHLPIKYWKECSQFKTLKKAPKWDGHTPEDVIKRLKSL